MNIEQEIASRYYDWVCSIAMPRQIDRIHYSKLLHALDSMAFRYSIDMDANRESDGIDLRYMFGESSGYSCSQIASVLDIRPCSVLEMMVALARRCENDIMYNPEYGDRTSFWFFSMIASLGLFNMTDNAYDESRVNDILNRFLDRQYAPDGSGGLFTVIEPRKDMRTVEIWYQANWYLTNLLESEGDIL